MSTHRYPARALTGDYLRAAAGATLTLGPLVLVSVAPVLVYILGTIGTLFLVFGARTLLRQIACVEVSAEELRVGGMLPVVLRWQDLNGMTLSYFSTQRDRRSGWMQLKLKGGHRTLRFDSSLEDFPVLAREASAAAQANRVALSSSTLANLTALGIAPGASNGET
ncbi:MAG: hypothetical protein ACE5H8_15545 [Alphaproteobacteria bacterium]